jgi:hypothetical protein
MSFLRVDGKHPQPALQPLGRYMRNAVWLEQQGEVTDKIIQTVSVDARPQFSVVVMCHTLLISPLPFKKAPAFPSSPFLRAYGEN